MTNAKRITLLLSPARTRLLLAPADQRRWPFPRPAWKLSAVSPLPTNFAAGTSAAGSRDFRGRSTCPS